MDELFNKISETDLTDAYYELKSNKKIGIQIHPCMQRGTAYIPFQILSNGKINFLEEYSTTHGAMRHCLIYEKPKPQPSINFNL